MNENEMKTEEAKKVLEQELITRIQSCSKEVEDVLKKYNCSLRIEQVIKVLPNA